MHPPPVYARARRDEPYELVHCGSKGKRTLDIHERAQLNLLGIMVLAVYRRRAVHEIKQRTVVYLLDFILGPVVACRRDGYCVCCLRDVGRKSAREANRDENRRSGSQHGGAGWEKRDRVSKEIDEDEEERNKYL